MKRCNEYQGNEEIQCGSKYMKIIIKLSNEYRGEEEIRGGRKYKK